MVLDALSRKVVEGYIAVLTTIETNFLPRIKKGSTKNQSCIRLMQQDPDGVTRKFWVEEGLLYAKGGLFYVQITWNLRKVLLKKTHNIVWGGLPCVKCTHALLAHSYF